MSSDRVPSRSEVMGWSPQQLADFMKRMNLSGCDKTVMKNSINGSRFVNLSSNDLQKFPKLHAPMISKISSEISRKEERRGLFSKKTTPKYKEPETTAEVQGWGEDEFDDEEFDDDYESPNSGGEDGSSDDYESPNDDADGANDYEPPPSEPPEDLAHKLCPTLPIGDGEYIDKRDNHMSSKGPPPAVCARPPVSTLAAPSPRTPGESSSRRDASPHCGGRQSGKFPPEPPKIFRASKPGRESRDNFSPIRGPHSTDRDPPPWSKHPVLPPSSSVSRSNSSPRPPPNRFDPRRDQTHDEAPKHNTFPLHSKSLPPRPGLPAPPSRHGESMPPSVHSAGSLPNQLQPAKAELRGSFVGSFRPPPSHTQELDPRWYVGKVTRGQAEGCLKQVQKDGAYLVRDSTRQMDNQPFTLMVFYQDKVYNIQIRQHNQNFQLGTGLKLQESFPSVREIIAHYSQSPLLLINAKDRSAGQQNQCLLSDPAGGYLTGQTGS
ncbi:lymphocyte cytosolic protein 2a [Hippoglossus hippoglossus]|uniref:lymphocyte cytosolic protein 2a n=1 Tax=Hippoglossus hippoglossus TaxID=8267 RepID=UPI00148B490A|nr:lymphocyte cytosolic protein 2a [Hippoglossus hippoglossus]